MNPAVSEDGRSAESVPAPSDMRLPVSFEIPRQQKPSTRVSQPPGAFPKSGSRCLPLGN